MKYIDIVEKLNKSLGLPKQMEAFASQVPKGSLVLDAGSGISPYRKLFAHAKYESADFHKVDKKYEPSTYICDLANIPVENERFDFVIFTQVMEHLAEPQKVLAELHRVLKKGGVMFASAPLSYEEHEVPYDFFRFTQFAWKKLLDDAGFEIQKLDWIDGYFLTLSHQFDIMNRLFSKSKIYYWPIKIFAKFFMILFLFLETKKKLKVGMPLNYFCIAVKS